MAYDLICIGAGPTGLATAIEAKRAGLSALVIDKGCLCNSIFNYPAHMIFFTTPELLEIGDLPMTALGEKPTRVEALKYYRKCTEHYQLDLRLYEAVARIEGSDGRFRVHTRSALGIENTYETSKLVIATGYYDLPNLMGIPGEDLPNVSHYYTEPHAFWNQDVVVIGAKNSAADAALELFRAGARVTIVHRGPELGRTIKYWVRPDIENRIKAVQVRALFNTRVLRVEEDSVWVANGEGERGLPARHVFALTGYHPDFDFLRSAGIKLEPKTNKPHIDSVTMETNVPGIFLAGVVIGGNHPNEIFIENGRFHGRQIVAALTGKSAPPTPKPVESLATNADRSV
ncbi:MAG TPA: YpdA family putative bacillithiol disulfide reductase [Candidatus Acidoferrales bacterium]|nr:YpdA family putative bacillithiol disulfide reductase [Candidatus Acidoferrales bacterium]